MKDLPVIEPKEVITTITNMKTGEKYKDDTEWKAKGIPESDIRKDVRVIMPSLDLFGETKQNRTMAITRAQQAKQMLQNGGMLVSPSEDGKRPGYRGDAAAAAGAPGMAGPGPGADPGNGGPTGAPSQDRIAEIRQANITLENLRQDKIEEKLEKFRRLGSNQRKFQS